MIRASFSTAPRIAPPSARHSAALAGAAWRTFLRHFRFHSFCASRLSRSSFTAMPSMKGIYVHRIVMFPCSGSHGTLCKPPCERRLLGTSSHRRVAMRPRSLIMLITALLFGCTSEHAAPQPEDQAAMHFHQQERQPAFAASRVQGEEFRADKFALTEIPEISVSTLPDIASNMIIRTATASVQVDSLEPAVTLVRDLATRLGGYVGSSGIGTGKNQLRQAAIEVKVPAARFDEVLSGLTPIGKLESVNVTAQDVGEEFVDVTARM